MVQIISIREDVAPGMLDIKSCLMNMTVSVSSVKKSVVLEELDVSSGIKYKTHFFGLSKPTI